MRPGFRPESGFTPDVSGYTPVHMLITPLTAPPTDTNRVRIDPLRIGQPIAFAAIFAMVMSAFLAGCAEPANPAAEPPPAAGTAVPAAADKSTITIQCPTRGAFGNGPTYYSQFYEDYILGYVFKSEKSGFYVDVGANDPDERTVTKYFYLAGWRGINIEPIPELVEKLNKSRPEDANIGVAISDTPGELAFFKYEGQASGLSTLSPKIAASHRAKGFKFTTIKVPVTTLNAVLDEHAKDKPEITFLNIDVEGFEKQVLSSIDFKRYHPRVIMAESTAPLTEVATHQLWESILIGNGYIFAMDDGLNRYYVHSSQESLLPKFLEADFCVRRDKLNKRLHLDGFEPR
jgi:FkbM family methyltransferase